MSGDENGREVNVAVGKEKGTPIQRPDPISTIKGTQQTSNKTSYHEIKPKKLQPSF